MKKYYVLLGFMLTSSLFVNAQALDYAPKDAIDHNGGMDFADSPERIADSIIEFIPDSDMSLHIPDKTERIITGRVTKLEKGLKPIAIVQPANTLIMPLKAGAPVKLFLARFPKRDVYYPVAIFPIVSGEKL